MLVLSEMLIDWKNRRKLDIHSATEIIQDTHGDVGLKDRGRERQKVNKTGPDVYE